MPPSHNRPLTRLQQIEYSYHYRCFSPLASGPHYH